MSAAEKQMCDILKIIDPEFELIYQDDGAPNDSLGQLADDDVGDVGDRNRGVVTRIAQYVMDLPCAAAERLEAQGASRQREADLLKAVLFVDVDWFPRSEDHTLGGVMLLLSMADASMSSDSYSPLDLVFHQISHGEQYGYKGDVGAWGWMPSPYVRCCDGRRPADGKGIPAEEDRSLYNYVAFSKDADDAGESPSLSILALKLRLLPLAQFLNPERFGDGGFFTAGEEDMLQSRGIDPYASDDSAFDSAIEADDLGEETHLSNFDDQAFDLAAEIRTQVLQADVARALDELDLKYWYAEEWARKTGKPAAPVPLVNYLFLGNPDTGMAMVASLLARFLHAQGCLAKPLLVSLPAHALMGTSREDVDERVAETFRKADGGLLYVSDLDALLGEKGEEAASEVLNQVARTMTASEGGPRVVVLAGREGETTALLEACPRLASRIGETIRFADYSSDELSRLFAKKAREAGYEVEDGALEVLEPKFASVAGSPDGANGEAVDALLDAVIMRHMMNYRRDQGRTIDLIAAGDAEDALNVCEPCQAYEM